MQKLILTLLLIITIASLTAQKKWQKYGFNPARPVCYASDKLEKSYIPPPPEALSILKSAEKKSEFVVNYSLFPPEAKKAFDFAASIWETLIESPVSIHIQANWRPKGLNVLGSCGPNDYEINFEGAPRKNVYYPIATVEKIIGKELTNSNRPDMTADFNKNIDWYFGIDGQTPDSLYDFVTVVLHEIAHGLGFTGFFFVENDEGGYGFWQMGDATSFDQLVYNTNGNQLVDTDIFPNPSNKLKRAFLSGDLIARSPLALAANNNFPRLYAPASWDGGSSIYHLNDRTYPASDPNSLMTHAAGKGEATHNPGPITLGIMADIGWKNIKIEFNPLKDREIISPVDFEVKLKSDYELDSSALCVVISVDSFATKPDTLPLLYSETDIFKAQFLPGKEISYLNYYISASDKKNRTFRNPSDAPSYFYTLNFGPDEISPFIEHEPIPFYFTAQNELPVIARVEDNLGIDTVYVEYAVNGTPQSPFGMTYRHENTYKGFFNFNLNQLNDGDEITYRIVARDASEAQNTSNLPFEYNFTFKIEKAYQPIAGYINDFNNQTTDFILSDFDIFKETGFDNGALHSPHPYPSPDIDDAEFNFITLLKYPIILAENAKMSFDEIVLVEPGSTGTSFGDFEFWDYVIVEGSKDMGETWLPFTAGYDARDNFIWSENFDKLIVELNSKTIGNPEWYINREIEMLENGNFSSGDTVLIRFRVYSDAYAHGWGWAIDNLRIQTPVSIPRPFLFPDNIAAYPNPFSNSFSVFIKPNAELKNLRLEVYNMFGQRIKTINQSGLTGGYKTEIRMDDMPKGLYLLSVMENGKQILTKKMIHY